MKLALALVVLQALPPPPAAEPPPRYEKTFREGFDEMAALAAKGEADAALAIADALLVPTSFARWAEEARADAGMRAHVLDALDEPLHAFGFYGLPAEARAQVHYAKGLLLASKGMQSGGEVDVLAIDGELERARSLGTGDLRLDAIYNLGCLDLALGETLRAEIPELKDPTQQPATPPPPPPGTPPGEEAPDPLELAKAAYSAAREHFVERLRADWRDEDTRANAELVQRRLKELEEIERQREEQQEEQQQQQDEQQGEDGEKKGQEDQEQQESEEQKQQEEEKKQEEPQPSEEEKKEEEQEGEEKKAEPKEIHLTKEQVMQLLQRLQEIEEEGENVREQLLRQRRVPVKRDW